jgi:hypothetical protein
MGSYDFPHWFYSSGNYRFFFIYFFKLSYYRFLERCIFIKGHIPTDLNVMVTWYINPEGLGDLTVSHK